MAINIFEGSRRIALLTAVLATLGTLAVLINEDPYVSINYSIAHPDGTFQRETEDCPSDAGKDYFTTETRSGKRVSIDLCLLTMSFGDKGEQLVPYKRDEKGMVWGAPFYSTEVSKYEKQLENRFSLSPEDNEFAGKEISRRHWKSVKEGLWYLAIGLAIFGAFVSAVGWIVRGFLGIPRGMDRRPGKAQQGAKADGPASSGPAAQLERLLALGVGTDTSKSANERSVLEYLIGERNLPINRSSIAKLLGDRMPDFRATTLDGELVAFEITEICAQEVARLISEAKRGETFAIHTADPTSYILTSKLSKRYAIDYPIELVCFWGGRTISTDDMIVPTMQCILESALANPFRRVWYVGEEEFREFPSAA